MPPNRTLNAANLERLGAPRLAALLLELATGNAAAQRRLRLALAGNAGPAEAARAVTKRLAAIARSRTWLNAPRIRTLVTDLEAQRHAILSVVAPADPSEAFELTWRLMQCAEAIVERSDDASGRLTALFAAILRDLGPLAQAASIDPAQLAERALRVLSHDRHGQWHELVPTLAPALGDAGLRLLAQRVEAWRDEPPASKPQATAARLHADQLEAIGRRHITADLLRQVALARGDLDAYLAQYDQAARQTPAVAADIARRLLAADRPHEAWAALQAASTTGHDRTEAWNHAHAETLDALDRPDEAQAFRWARFSQTLDPTHLRAHLRRLPDFDEFEAEQRALTHALTHPSPDRALFFLIDWPDLSRAAELVLARSAELDPDLHESLTRAAESLEARHQLPATLLYRAMIDATLQAGRSSRYRSAARQWQACARLAPQIEDFGTAPNHRGYNQQLRERYGRKQGFWQELELSQQLVTATP